jgi:iron complex outermembrane recepter protein
MFACAGARRNGRFGGRMSKQPVLLLATSSLAVLAASAAQAQDTDNTVSEVIVQSDKAGLLERRPSDTVFGLDKPLIETPRSASFISDVTLERYGIQKLDQLTAVSPGTYTASFYGVAGALNIRGSLAENYFLGFKRIENIGTYTTPIGDAARIEILRGPPSPIYGSGKIGGLMNFIPKSARDTGAYLTDFTGEVALTGGSYGKKVATAQAGVPLNLGGDVEGGAYGYFEIEDSDSFYRGIHPKHQLGEVSLSFDLGSGWSTAVHAMLYHSTGDVQTAGWNRLTQDLIDNQNYTTGRNTALTDSNNNGRLEPCEVQLAGFCAYPFTVALYKAYFGFPPTLDARFPLTTGVGTVKLDPRTVHNSSADFSRVNTYTFYYDLAKALGESGELKLQLFYDKLDTERFVSYGFPSDFNARVWEGRLTYKSRLASGDESVVANTIVGLSYRSYKGRKKETFNSGMIALDRRDIAFGATPTDIMASPFDPLAAVGWEIDIQSRWDDTALFGTTDITIADRLDLILGGRYDVYDADSIDTGIFSFETADPQSAKQDRFTYSASVTYKLPFGVMPYVTHALSSSLEIGQAGDIAPGFIQAGDRQWVSESKLTEGGLKFQGLEGTLVASIAYYKQDRTRISGLNNNIVHTRGKGVEYEVRWVATDNLSFTLAGNNQKTTVFGPDRSTVYLPPFTAGLQGVNSWGGALLAFDLSTLPGRSGNYRYTLVPRAVNSAFATYTSDEYDWGLVGATVGFTHATKTSGVVPNAIVYPAYTVVNGSVTYMRGPIELTLNVDNMFDKLYFTPDQDVYANIGALPSIGRTWRLTLKGKF